MKMDGAALRDPRARLRTKLGLDQKRHVLISWDCLWEKCVGSESFKEDFANWMRLIGGVRSYFMKNVRKLMELKKDPVYLFSI